MKTLESKVALVTGAGQGVGQGIAFALAEEGARVAVAGRTLAKLGQPEDIAKAALYLASDDSVFVTGTALVVNEGPTAHSQSSVQRCDSLRSAIAFSSFCVMQSTSSTRSTRRRSGTVTTTRFEK